MKGLSQAENDEIIPPNTFLLGYRGSIAHGMYVPSTDPNSTDDKDIMHMLLFSRLRPGDLQRLTSNEIDVQRKRIDLIQHKTITNANPDGIQIIIPISERMLDILMPRLAKTKPGSQLFPFRNMQRRWKELRKKACVPHVQLRDFRRTAATFLLDSGQDPFTVAQGLGHQSLEMLPTYTPRTILHQQKSLEILEKNF